MYVPEQEQKQVSLKVQRPTVVGVYADEVMMLRIDDRLSLSFVQVYDLKESEAHGQIAALVYMPLRKAKEMSEKLTKLIEEAERQ